MSAMFDWQPVATFPDREKVRDLGFRETVETIRGDAVRIRKELSESEHYGDLSINGIDSIEFCDGTINLCDFLLGRFGDG